MVEETKEEPRKTLAQWAKELDLNASANPENPNVMLTREQALGVMERAALVRKGKQLGGWIARRLGAKDYRGKVPMVAAERIAELRKAGNTALAEELEKAINSAAKVSDPLGQEIEDTKKLAQQLWKAGDHDKARSLRAYMHELERIKEEKKFRVRP